VYLGGERLLNALVLHGSGRGERGEKMEAMMSVRFHFVFDESDSPVCRRRRARWSRSEVVITVPRTARAYSTLLKRSQSLSLSHPSSCSNISDPRGSERE
jgi:hypothetical protein